MSDNTFHDVYSDLESAALLALLPEQVVGLRSDAVTFRRELAVSTYEHERALLVMLQDLHHRREAAVEILCDRGILPAGIIVPR
ncbi:MAG: hypothetical protein Q4F67_14720 [Propionibacteriaceae bacterium]|nr:hypothetical protein [Propionibacteriaceae bacterium]